MTNPANTQSAGNGAAGRIFFLDLAGSRVLSANPDGSDLKTILVEKERELPDGLVVDLAAGHQMFTATFSVPSSILIGSLKTSGSISFASAYIALMRLAKAGAASSVLIWNS